MIILGIDPGLATIGIGILEKQDNGSFRVLDACTIETAAGLPLADRLAEIEKDLSEIIEQCRPDCAVVEKLFFETNRKTGIDVAQARGVILLALAKGSISVVEPTPLELKSAITGDGHADKQQMLSMLQRTLSMDLSHLRDDAVDALGCAVFGGSIRDFVEV